MGASLCCMKPSPPPKTPREPTCSTTIIAKSPEKVVVKTHKRVYIQEEEEEGDDGGIATLKEWLVKSPNNNIGHIEINPTKLQVVNTRSLPVSSQVMNSPEVPTTEFYTPRISFSFEENVVGKLEKIDERDEDENKENEGLRFTLERNPSGKVKKTVAFQENDIFFFYSPKTTFDI